MGSKQTGTSTTTQNSSPWIAQQPYLTDIFSEAQGLYEGAPPEYYPGQTYASFNPMQTEGLEGIEGTTSNPLPTDAAAFNSGLVNGGYLWANPALAGYSGYADGTNPYIDTLGEMSGTNFGAEAPTNEILSAYARGDYVGQDNAYTDELIDSIKAQVMPGIQAQFINSGTLASPEAARASAEGVTNAVADDLFKQQQIDQENQLGAAQYLSGTYMQGGALQAQIAKMAADAQLSGLGGLNNSYQSGVNSMVQGLGLSPSTYAGLVAPWQNLFTAGSAQQQQDQTAISDEMARWNFEQTLPWDMLNQYIGQVTGNYGGTTTMTQPFYSNPFQSAVSGLGAVGGLLKSDRRVKDDIRRIGTLDNGLPVYTFRYIGELEIHIGLMADEVEQVHPEAVQEIGGIKHVDYGRAVT